MKTLTQNIALTIVLNLSLFANTDQSNTKTQEYLNKLPKYKGNLEISPETIREKAGDLSIQSLREKIQNTDLSKFGDMELLEPDKEYLKNAQEIKDFTNTREFKKELKVNEDYILYDKGINFSKYTGHSKDELEFLRNGSHKLLNKNHFLNNNEKIFIVISSSLSREMILNYFRALEKVNTDVTFILQGLIGNDISKLNPTIDYIKDLLIKDRNAPLDTPNNAYIFQIEINPKVTQKFNIIHAPAVIFIKNYDKTIQESQELQEISNKEQAFIAYGAVNINYALREINKKAKSKGLEKLLGKLDESFFSKQSGK